MSSKFTRKKQDENLAKLVMSAFNKLTLSKNGATSEDVVRLLRDNFGDVWQTGTLMSKTEQTLSRSAALGFLDHRGKRYAVAAAARGACCRSSRKKCGCSRKSKRLGNCRKKRRRSCRRSRRARSRSRRGCRRRW